MTKGNKKKDSDSFDWFENEIGRGKPFLSIDNEGKAYFVTWRGNDIFDYRSFDAAFNLSNFEQKLSSLFNLLKDTKLVNRDSLLNIGVIGGLYNVNESFAKLVYDLVAEEFNKALKIIADVYKAHDVPYGFGSFDYHKLEELIEEIKRKNKN